MNLLQKTLKRFCHLLAWILGLTLIPILLGIWVAVSIAIVLVFGILSILHPELKDRANRLMCESFLDKKLQNLFDPNFL